MSSTVQATKPRKRDRFRALLSSSSTSTTTPQPSVGHQSPGTTSPAPAQTPVQPNPNLLSQSQASYPVNNNILERALQRLADKERTTIKSYIATNATDIEAALQQALDAAHTQQDVWSDKRWRVTFGSKEIVLREHADKVVDWVNKVVPFGDAVTAVDPVHAGLPWAGFKLLLEASTSDSKQMATVLDGCETALYMADRLKVYLEYAHVIPSSQAHENLVGTLVEFYAAILEFLARALQTYQLSTLRRMVSAIWTVDDIDRFVSQCDVYRSKVHDDATACELSLNVHDRKKDAIYRDNLDKLLNELKQWRGMHQSFQKLEIKMDLSRLPYAEGAMFGSFGESFGDCHPGTRVELLDQIKTWASDVDAPTIFWLHGKAGFGKSTICRTVARWLDSQRLLNASFFFKRGGGDCETARRFCPTIARQLVQKIPELASSVAESIDHDPLIFDKTVSEQFEQLILKPLDQYQAIQSNMLTRVVIIDALDECNSAEDIGTILKKWSHLRSTTSNRFKLFVTSRPEISVCKDFESLANDVYCEFDLHQVADTVYSQDLMTFFIDEFWNIRSEHNKQNADNMLGDEWPSTEDLQALVDMAHPLFIVAATAARFVRNHYDPEQQLKVLLANRGLGRMSQIDRLYGSVMEGVFATAVSSREDMDVALRDLRDILGSIVTLAEPLSSSALSILLQIPRAAIAFYLRPLRSVLVVPSDPAMPIRPFHLSFVEYLLNRKVFDCGFEINERAVHKTLFTRCIKFLDSSNALYENMCQASHPGTLRTQFETTIVDKLIPAEVQHACRFWGHHLQHSEEVIDDNGPLLAFLRDHALHWLEVMGWTGRVSEALLLVQFLYSWADLKAQTAPQLLSFVQSLYQLIRRNRYIIDTAPLQLYSSAIMFAPESNVIRKVCGQIPSWIQLPPQAPQTWDDNHTVLETADLGVATKLSFSHSGNLLASAFSRNRITLWNVVTGVRLQTMEDPGPTKDAGFIAALAFTPDDIDIVTVFYDGTITTWNLETGQSRNSWYSGSHGQIQVAITSDASTVALQVGPTSLGIRDLRRDHTTTIRPDGFDGHSKLAFSPDNKLLAIECYNKNTGDIAIWSTTSAIEKSRLRIPRQESAALESASIAFSHDCRLLASGGYKHLIIWDTLTGRLVNTLWNQHEPLEASAVVFLNNNELLVVRGDTISILFDLETGSEQRRLGIPTDSTIAVALSATNRRLVASSSFEGTIRLWDTSSNLKPTKVPDLIYTIELLPRDEHRFVLGTRSGSVALWDIEGNECGFGYPTIVRNFHGYTEIVRAFAFSAHDSQLMATLASIYTEERSKYSLIIKFWDLDTGQERYKPIEYDYSKDSVSLWRMTFSTILPHILITADLCGNIALWNPKTGQKLHSVRSTHLGDIAPQKSWYPRSLRMELSPNESLKLFAWFDESTVYLYDIYTGECVQKDEEHGRVKSLEWSSEGPDYTLRVHRVPYHEPISRLEITRDWVRKDGKNLLWLPLEYRSRANVAREDTGVVLLCTNTGDVTLMKIDMSFDGL